MLQGGRRHSRSPGWGRTRPFGSGGFGGVERGAELVDVGAVTADGLVESLAADAELLGPIGDVGGELRVDVFGVVRPLGGSVFVRGVGGVLFGGLFVLVLFVLGQGVSLFLAQPIDEEGGVRGGPGRRRASSERVFHSARKSSTKKTRL